MGAICTSSLTKPAFDEKTLPYFVKNPNRITNEYRVEDLIAYVSPYYSVYKCTHIKTKRLFAMRKHLLGAKSNNDLLYELSLNNSISHPSAIKIIEYFKTDNCLFVINEFFDGKNLPEYVLDIPKFEEHEVVSIIRQLLTFVNYLHEKQIIHRNLTPGNLMYNGTVIKVINFNRAVRFKHGQRFSERMSSSHFQAPEMIKGKYNSKVDVWAVGITAFILLIGKPPFDGSCSDHIASEILTKEITDDVAKGYDVSADALDFLKLILTKSKTKRPKADELLKHPWVKGSMARPSNLKLNDAMIQNLKAYAFNDKFQKAIYSFLVSRMVNEEEKALALKEFQKLDSNSNGLLSKEEIIKGLQNTVTSVSESDAVDIFNKLDRRQAGVIEYTEFLEAFVDREAMLQEENLSACFDLLDTNRTGVLMLRDLEKVFGDTIDSQYIQKKFKKYAKGIYIDKGKFMAMLKEISTSPKRESLVRKN